MAYFHHLGQKVVALIETAQPICVERFADYPQLGRFTLRDEGRSIEHATLRFANPASSSRSHNSNRKSLSFSLLNHTYFTYIKLPL